MAFYELRQYKIHPGKMKDWLALMEETIIPFQVSKGMVITGSYSGEEDETVYIWTRRFTDEAQRKALYEAVYESDYWKNDVAPKIPELMDRSAIQVTRIVTGRVRSILAEFDRKTVEGAAMEAVIEPVDNEFGTQLKVFDAH